MNVLSLKSVVARHRLTYDSKDCGGVFQIHTPNGVVEFKPSKCGPHYLDMAEYGDSIQHMLVTATGDHKDEGYEDEEKGNEDEQSNNLLMVNTVRKNFEGFIKHEIKMAQEARKLQGMIGNPMDREFTGMVHEKLIANSPVTVHDVQDAYQIFGPDLANLRGKTTRSKSEHMRVDYVKIPWDFVEMHKYVTIVADMMFVNGLPFLVISSRGISLITIEFLPSRTAKCLASSMEQVVRIYIRAGFIVQTSMMDMKFEKLGNMLPGITLNTTAAQEHVGEIEKKVRVIKKSARGTISVLPYKILTNLMIFELMHFCVMWLNSFPVRSGTSEKYCPRNLVSRHKLDTKLHCKSPFGAYCEVHTDPDITNTTEPRTRWGICLGPTGNLQGCYKFMLLSTGKKINRRNFTEMPITESVIKQVSKWASKD